MHQKDRIKLFIYINVSILIYYRYFNRRTGKSFLLIELLG